MGIDFTQAAEEGRLWVGYKFTHHPDFPQEDLRYYSHKLYNAFRAAHFPAYEVGDMVLVDTFDIVALDSIRRQVLDDSRIRVRADAVLRKDSDLQAEENKWKASAPKAK